ncbi:GatB/YqeY domain-containing protein [Acetilactobacillus jinshanensis]|uniref:GatB/YqeY domain-containing protein n=1 Tax=Acetilactobacillus jinshanensis TaxID=1720083 RepID=A0A4P6ZL55_9LACO|nr:GatB/YqeY domain-containing protein [Acetilactobacillus jinshanensis]QBP17980.1 GatB/YqeY domain-containing protein [Acetilactobacillus jinshanensis]URL60842.1 GatB/YqeY domain-containing protein [uncultured bacterium]
MSLNETLTKDMIKAMKARDNSSLSVIRQLKTDLTNKKIALGRDLTPKDETAVVMHEVKQHKESIDAFKKGKRADLVKEQETYLKALMKYAPKPLTSDQVKKLVSDTIKQVHATSMKDFGKVMGTVMGKAKGRANGTVINKMVRQLLK